MVVSRHRRTAITYLSGAGSPLRVRCAKQSRVGWPQDVPCRHDLGERRLTTWGRAIIPQVNDADTPMAITVDGQVRAVSRDSVVFQETQE